MDLQQLYCVQMHSNLSIHVSQLKKQRQSSLGVIKKIREISAKLTYKAIERINSTSLFEVDVKHTHQFTIQIGAGYFVQLTAENAILLLERRIKNIEKLLQKHLSPHEQHKKQSTYAKPKTVEIQQQGNKKSYMEVIGQQNGEEIFNIVEIQGQAQNQQTSIVQQPTNIVQSKQDASNKDAAIIQPIKEDQEGQQEDENQSKKSQESQNEYGDLIHYHRKHILGVSIPDVSVSTPEIPKPEKPKELISMQQINPAVPQKKKNKQKKRVSFADHLITKAQDPKEQVIEEKSKQKVKEDSKKVKEEVKNIEKALTGKVSKFKLERMKARLQKQDS